MVTHSFSQIATVGANVTTYSITGFPGRLHTLSGSCLQWWRQFGLFEYCECHDQPLTPDFDASIKRINLLYTDALRRCERDVAQ